MSKKGPGSASLLLSRLRGLERVCVSLRMKLEGKDKADVTAKALQMSLAYQFVTPLTSMTIRGMTDEDGLEPIIDKPPEGVCSATGSAVGLGRLLRVENLLGFNSLPLLFLPDSLPLGEFQKHVGFQKAFPVAGQAARAPAARHGLPAPHPLSPSPQTSGCPFVPGEPLRSLHPGLCEPVSAEGARMGGRVPRGGGFAED